MGIIASFKARYKSKLAHFMVQQYDLDPHQHLQELSLKVNVKQAIDWLLVAWRDVSNTTIVNCWCKAGVLPEEWSNQLRPDRAAVLAAEAGETAQMREIATAITRLPVSQDEGQLTALEWVMDPGETEIEEVESIADIAARLMGQEDASIEEEVFRTLVQATPKILTTI
ncbi:hypothetical protein EMCRGX_G033839 [Ephydatia muelleri]